MNDWEDVLIQSMIGEYKAPEGMIMKDFDPHNVELNGYTAIYNHFMFEDEREVVKALLILRKKISKCHGKEFVLDEDSGECSAADDTTIDKILEIVDEYIEEVNK